MTDVYLFCKLDEGVKRITSLGRGNSANSLQTRTAIITSSPGLQPAGSSCDLDLLVSDCVSQLNMDGWKDGLMEG